MTRMMLLCAIVASFVSSAAADEKGWPPDYYRAHYLVTVENQPEAAAKLFERVAADRSLTDEQRETVLRRLRDARERIVAQDLSRLCPAESLAFVQIHQPGAMLERLTTMMGIETKPILPLLMNRKPVDAGAGFRPVVPEEIAVSPALMRWFKAFNGAAVAITGVRERHPGGPEPDGILILDAGDADLVRGLVETAAQAAPPAEPIGGYPALQMPEGVVVALTERFIIAGRPRADVEAAVARIKGEGGASLASSKSFQKLMRGKEGATLFAYVDAQQALALAKPHFEKDQEFQMVRSLADLDHLVGAAVALGAIDTGLGIDVSVAMEEGHHNLIYNLIRTPPMSRRTLAFVPQRAAVVFGLGLNPADETIKDTGNGKAAALSSVTGLDIFRELFGNIQEITFFAAPAEGGLLGGTESGPRPFMPNGAIIIAARDANKSRALWTQLLTLPSIIMGNKAAKPRQIDIAGHSATVFSIPEVGPVYVAEVKDCLILAPRKEAMSAVIRTSESGKSVLTDAALKPVLDRIHSDVGLMLLVHAGRAMKAGAAIAAGMGEGPPPGVVNMMTGQAASSLDSTIVYVGLAPGETELNLRVCLAGLPNVNRLLKQFGPLARMALQMRGDGASHPARAERRIVREPSERDARSSRRAVRGRGNRTERPADARVAPKPETDSGGARESDSGDGDGEWL